MIYYKKNERSRNGEVQNVKKTVCELFAGVGGFRCGLNHIKTVEDRKKLEK